MKKFCIIAVDYENHVPRDENNQYKTSIFKGLTSLSNQTFKNFNVVICHDGPKSKTYEEEGINLEAYGFDYSVINTPERMSDWGHSSRDFAMRYAYENELGEYFIQFNIDNEFFPNAFEIINNYINDFQSQVFTFQVHHWKAAGGGIFPADNPVVCGIDCMQLVAHRNIWKEINFWYDRSGCSDGEIYKNICNTYHWVPIHSCLGHNY